MKQQNAAMRDVRREGGEEVVATIRQRLHDAES